jgi:carboxypeptidase family protein
VKRLIVACAFAASACGGSSTPSAPSSTTPPATGAAIATVGVSAFTVTADTSGATIIYTLRFVLNETSGRSGATITAITYRFADGATASTTISSTLKIPAGGAWNPGALTLNDTSGRPVTTSVNMSVAFTDDAGRAGSMTETTAIQSIKRYALTGFVRDRSTGQNLNGATVSVTSGPDNGQSATTNSGYYAFAALQAGTFDIRATASGHNAVVQSVTLSQNLQVDLTVPASAPPAPSVEYRITGSARRCDATYENSTGGTNQATVDVPFSYSWNGARSGDFLYMSCQISTGGDRGDITVAIYKNGSLYRSATASGFPNIATASGSY